MTLDNTADGAAPKAGPPAGGGLASVIEAVGDMLKSLDPGPLAELRRATGHDRPPAYWRLASQHDLIGRGDPDAWLAVVQAMAILTEKGRASAKPSPHFEGRPLGQALCDGADAAWPYGAATTPRPMLSEPRLARLIAARGEQRRALLLRAVRMLAARRSSGAGVNCVELARLLLRPNEAGAADRLAQTYYRRLDRASRSAADPDQLEYTGGDA